MKNILTAIDFSDATEKVLEYARDQAEASGSKLHLVHVWDPSTAYDTAYGAEPTISAEIQEQHREEMEQKLAERAQALSEYGVASAHAFLVGHPVDQLIAYARENEVELLVVGSHGHTALGSLLLGSVAQGLVRKSLFPILVVPAVAERDSEEES